MIFVNINSEYKLYYITYVTKHIRLIRGEVHTMCVTHCTTTLILFEFLRNIHFSIG